ncbi:MAG: endopeptidase La [Thermodesulfobacteriota bacterium]|nr:endopeptidase La [Thermodesulfobacteriota bacterium]
MFTIVIENNIFLPSHRFVLTISKYKSLPLSDISELAIFFHHPISMDDIGLKCIVKGISGPNIILEGVSRIIAKEPLIETEGFIEVTDVPDIYEKNFINDGLIQGVKALIRLILPGATNATRIKHPGQFADAVAQNLNLGYSERLKLLNTPDSIARIKLIFGYLNRQNQRHQHSQVPAKGIMNPLIQDIKDLEEKIEHSPLSEEAWITLHKEIDKLKYMHPSSPEYSVSRSYIEFVLDLPWEASTQDDIDIEKAQKILDKDHFDLKEVKDRILEFLAVKKLNPASKGSILCFCGPPGVGKTSLGKSIASATSRHYIRVSLGGIRDEAEIRGHRRTYIGAMPGRIIKEIQRSKTKNPVFILDEIDKLGKDFRGDPASALLEVLDPEQNFSFKDNYLEIPFDLSNVMFIGTANTTETIPPTLLDRMEVIEISGYTDKEKMNIANLYLVSKRATAAGISPATPGFEDDAINLLITNYTMEAGVRELERKIEAIYRKLARKKATGRDLPDVIDKDIVHEYLGPAPRYRQSAMDQDGVGITTGLAWTPAGGDILIIETTSVAGSGKLELTGNMGNTMQESAKIALGFIKSHTLELGINNIDFSKIDIHIHVPAGAISKDGPSAGLAMLSALVSLLKDVPVRKDAAITGEATLSGRVLPVGGIKEKILAGIRAGISYIILPEKNKPDIEKLVSGTSIDVEIIFADKVTDVLPFLFRESFGTDFSYQPHI